MKFKAGNRVTVRSIEWYDTNKDDEGIVNAFVKDMAIHCGDVLIIKEVCKSHYKVEGNNFVWDDYMFEECAGDNPIVAVYTLIKAGDEGEEIIAIYSKMSEAKRHFAHIMRMKDVYKSIMPEAFWDENWDLSFDQVLKTRRDFGGYTADQWKKMDKYMFHMDKYTYYIGTSFLHENFDYSMDLI